MLTLEALYTIVLAELISNVSLQPLHQLTGRRSRGFFAANTPSEPTNLIPLCQ